MEPRFARYQSVDGKKRDLEAYVEFLRIDLQLSLNTARKYKLVAGEFLQYLGDRPLSADEVRGYLKRFLDASAHTYANRVKGLRRFLRDWLGLKELAEQFKFPVAEWVPPEAPTTEELRRFYKELPTLESRAAFMLWATAGKRRNEVIYLTRDRINLEARLIAPQSKGSRTKHEWFSVFNEECQQVLGEYLATLGAGAIVDQQQQRQKRIFSMKRVRNAMEASVESSGVNITPQRLRDWFCQTMGELSVPDRFIDAYCGRTPKSVLARHYSDYSPERLKRIYDQAGLKVGGA